MLGMRPVADGAIAAEVQQISVLADNALGDATQSAAVAVAVEAGVAITLNSLSQNAGTETAIDAAASQTLAELSQVIHTINSGESSGALADLEQSATVAVAVVGVSTALLEGLTADEAVSANGSFVGRQVLHGITQEATGLATINLPECGSGWVRPAGRALDALLRHLPEGVAWIAWRLPGKTAYRFCKAVARAYDDIWVTLCRLAAELDPRSTNEMVGEWEQALNLPDPCLPVAESLEARRNRIMLRLSMRRWTTAQDWIELASLFGLTITVTPGWYVQKPALYPACYPKRYDLFPKLGRFRVYIDIGDVEFPGYDYGIHGPGYPIPYGINAPAATAFMCMIERIRPANVVVLWNRHPRSLPCVWPQ